MKLTWKTLKIGVFEKFAPILPDRLYLHLKYYVNTGKILHLDHPVTFNEKIQWLKLYGRKPVDAILADKVAVKDYIANNIGNQYVIPLLGVWSSFNDIDFNQLPDQFVLKTSHDSGGVVVCKDKATFDIEKARKKLTKSLNRDYFIYSRETAYKNLPKRIFAEEYKEDTTTHELRDYKFFCFGGKVHFFKVDFGRYVHHRANYFDCEGNLIKIGEQICPPDYNVKIIIPSNLNDMIKLAERLSYGMPFVRVDLYDVDNSIYFGEMTFSPAGGMGLFTDENTDKLLGELIKLPVNENNQIRK